MNGQTNTILLGVIAVLLGIQVFAGLTKSNNSPAPRPAATQTQSPSQPQAQQTSLDNQNQQELNLEGEDNINPNAPEPTGPRTTVAFNETFYDFGTIPEGVVRTKNFKFTNTGSEPLIISNARGSCGCTVPDYPKHPIAPGESGEITVEYNSTNRSGNVSNTVTITANTEPADNVIRISANVVKES